MPTLHEDEIILYKFILVQDKIQISTRSAIFN